MTHRVLAGIAGVLFLLFVLAGAVAMIHFWPTVSCGTVAPTVSGASNIVEVAGPGWSGGIKPNDCVQLSSNHKQGFNLGPAPVAYGGSTWDYVRVAIGAWIAWTLAMMLLAFAVALIPSVIPGGSQLDAPES